METAFITPIETLTELQARGYTISVKTRVEVTAHKVGAQAVTYGDKCVVRGPQAPPEHLREAMHAYRKELLAAACVVAPPVPWVAFLVGRCKAGRAPIIMLAANIATFIGLHPAHDVSRLEPIIEEALSLSGAREVRGA